jgi:hypothetical protein
VVLKKLLRKLKYGDPVIVVSGLPRSGTSMMMKMLEAAGLPILTDQVRKADDDNPKGYYEYERVKDLEKETDKSYVRQARGKVLKVISFLLKDLPPDNYYRVIFMLRDVDEVLASQNKMLHNRGESNEVEDAKMREVYHKHLVKVRRLVGGLPNFEMLELDHKAALADPLDCAERVSRFLGGRYDVEAMAGVVDESLYRNRKERLARR